MSTQLVELLILGAVAAFILYRLRSVIGTRTGYEAPPEQMRPRGPRPVDTDAEGQEPVVEPVPDVHVDDMSLPPETREAVAAMRATEPDFSLDEFMGGARQAYEMVLMAYEEGDRDLLRDLLAPDVYSAFVGVIDEREAEGLTVEARFIGVRDIRVETVTFDQETSEADVTLRFTGELITAVRDSENRIVEGDPNEIRRQTDVWTFSRVMGAPNPNWLLTATGE
ncbi:MAG: Tim44/TimA family putative adaptor protein [Pseudomonadota bacterium]